MSADFGEQLTFSGLEPKPKRAGSRHSVAGAPKITSDLPVASVVVEKLPVHLDQLFDYLVPEKFADIAVPGAAVKVPFGGQQLDGFIVERLASSTHTGRLAPLKSVVSKVPLISDESLTFFRKVADYYSGALGDVLRLAVPPRHAATEKAFIDRFLKADSSIDEDDQTGTVLSQGESDTPKRGPVLEKEATPEDEGARAQEPESQAVPLHLNTTELWSQYTAGKAFVDRVSVSCSDEQVALPRAVWTSLPGFGFGMSDSASSNNAYFGRYSHWTLALASLALMVRDQKKRTLIVVPTAKDVKRLVAVLIQCGAREGAGTSEHVGFVTLTHELRPAQRYGNYLLATFGFTDIVIGTRAAALTPIPDLGLVVCWDDGDSSHQDLHSPYPHSREMLSLRSETSNCALLVGGYGRTLHAQSLLTSGWAGEIAAPREVLRELAPHVVEFGEYEIAADSGGKNGRLPQRVWREISNALKVGPVLVQVPRSGYLPHVACGRCREAAKCTNCHGPLGLGSAAGAPQCRWCGALSGAWACMECGFTGIRAIRVGSERTAEELGRAFPGVPVISSAARARDGVVEEVKSRPSLVVATPGAEPFVEGGYVLGVLLDAHVSSGGSGLYAHQEALMRWQNAAALVKARTEGGRVYLVGRGAQLPTSALVRWNAPALAVREIEERAELHLPPVWRVASVAGDRTGVSQFLSAVNLPEGSETLGPVVVDGSDVTTLDESPHMRAVIRVPMRAGRELARSLNAMARIASAKRQAHKVDVVLDPKELL